MRIHKVCQMFFFFFLNEMKIVGEKIGEIMCIIVWQIPET